MLRFEVLVTLRSNVEAFRAFFKSVIRSSPIHVDIQNVVIEKKQT